MNLAEQVDLLYTLREDRINAEKEVVKRKKVEAEVKQEIIDEMRNEGVSSIGGAHGQVSLRIKDKPVARDWDALYSYIKENDAFDLLHKRLTEKAITLRWEDELEVPGVDKFPVPVLSLSKSKGT